MTRASIARGRVMYVSRAIGLPAVLFLAGACSPYVYQKEIALFSKGVDDTVTTFEQQKLKERARRIEKRDESLKKEKRPITLSEACDDLRGKYDAGFAKDARNVLTEGDYRSCRVDPAGEQIDPLLPNLTAIGEGLKRYAAALGAITNANDVTQLQSAFTEFNNSAAGLVEAVNGELSAQNKQKLNAIAGLVYQTGIIYLNQSRFNALKKAVNDTHPVVKTAANLLAEASFDMYGPDLSAQDNKLLDLQKNARNTKPGDDYLRAWLALKAQRDAYIELFKASPVGVFQQLTDAHEALRQSVNDPANEAQIQQVLANAKAFQASAGAALELFRKNDGGGK